MVVSDNPVLSGQAVNRPALAAWQELLRLLQRRLEQVFGKDHTRGVTVQSVRAVTASQGDNAIECVHPDLGLEIANLGLAGVFPEFAIQISAGARITGVVFKAGGIA